MVEHSPVFAELELFVRDQRRKFVAEVISPWMALVAGKSPRLNGIDYRPDGGGGLAFSGALADRYWSLLDPALRELVIRCVRHAVTLADERSLERAGPLADVRSLLRGVVGGLLAEARMMSGALSRATHGDGGEGRDTVAMVELLRCFLDEVVQSWLPSGGDAGECTGGGDSPGSDPRAPEGERATRPASSATGAQSRAGLTEERPLRRGDAMVPSGWLTVADACARYGLPSSTVHSWRGHKRPLGEGKAGHLAIVEEAALRDLLQQKGRLRE